MNIGITGCTGFIGARIAELARKRGHEVTGYSRQPREGLREFSTNKPLDVSGLDAVINLAGESIFGLWTAEKKRRIVESRVEGTRRIVEAMGSMQKGPRVLINASAIGYYGDTGEQIANEASPAGQGFLAEVCKEWEEEAQKGEKDGLRVAVVRTGFVLGHGGALKMIRPVFSLGIGGNLGNGKQWMSGIHVDDLAGMYLHAVEDEALSGPINAVMPDPFRNEKFTREVGKVLHRPTIFPAPAPVLRLVTGELAHLFLDSSRVAPAIAVKQGFVFRYPDLAGALREALR